MSERAKLFKNGGSQAVRLPADCRFPEDQREVAVKRIGRKVILEPINEWPETFATVLVPGMSPSSDQSKKILGRDGIRSTHE